MLKTRQDPPYTSNLSDPPPHWRAVFIAILAGIFFAMITLPPGTGLFSALDGPVSNIMWVFRLLLVPTVALLVYLFLMARTRVQRSHTNADRQETLLKNLPGMAYRCLDQRHWPMEFASGGCYALCGYERQELEEKQVLWGEFTHPDEIEYVEKSIHAAVAKNEPFEVEYRIITRTGEIKWVWERGRAVGVMGEVTLLEGLITDITDRKLAEHALMQAEAFATAVVDTAVEAVITTDETGLIETFNRAAQHMFAYTLEEVMGENILILLPESYHEDYQKFISHYLKNHVSQMVGMGHDVTGKRQDNSEFPIHLSISEISYQGEQKKYVFLIRDLSIQRAAEKELREQREQLAHVDRLNTLGEMATIIAHEINQPLTAISMYAQSGLRFLVSEKPNRSERLQDALGKLIVQTHRASSVVERVQQLSRRHESASEAVDCNTLIQDVHKLAEVEAHIRDIVITLNLSPLLPTVMCDPIQIQQVVLNLLRNGMESMKIAGCKDGNRIVLCTSRSAADVKVSVIDSGTGIPDSYVARLYRPFSTTKKAGMGMGLSISRSIIRAHGGQLEFTKNANNNGVTFYFTLPVCAQKRHD